MRVVHVIIGLNVGGAELMLQRLVGSFQDDAAQEHFVVSLTDLGIVGPLLQKQGINVSTMGMRGVYDIPKVMYRLYRFFRQKQPDIVQTWMYHADLIGGVAARLAGIRNVIWGIRTTDVGGGVSRVTGLIRTVCAALSSKIPRVIVCAAEASRKAHVNIGYDNSKMIVIPNGFNPEVLTATTQDRNAIRATALFASGDLVVGSLGRYNPDKDHENFIRAALLLCADSPNVKFLLVGRELNRDNKTLISLIEAAGYSDRFVLLGERRDVAACLKAMDIFCLHSRTEGFPNVLGEAMTVGLPCVATHVGDAAFLLGDAGIIVEPENCEALAEGLRRIIALNHNERVALGEKARQRVHDNFTMDCAKARFTTVYEQISASKEFH